MTGEMKHERLARLVERAKEGDEYAFAEIYHEFSKSVYYMGLRITKNEDDADEIVQETMLSVYKNLHSIKSPKALVAYVNRVASNKAIDLMRKSNPLQSDDYAESLLYIIVETNEDYIPEEYLEKKEMREHVVSLIDELSPAQSAVIILFYYKQLSGKQIAKLLNINEAAVEMRLSRARAALKKKLQQNYERQGEEIYVCT